MRFFLFRHADREQRSQAEPGLTSRGFQQAENLARLCQEKKIPAADRILVSPRIRARQTFEPMARHLKLELSLSTDLDERQGQESSVQFAKRVVRFLEFAEGLTGNIYACTHFDWIEESLTKINSDTDLLAPQFHGWAPAQFLEFEVHDGLWQLQQKGRIEC